MFPGVMQGTTTPGEKEQAGAHWLGNCFACRHVS